MNQSRRIHFIPHLKLMKNPLSALTQLTEKSLNEHEEEQRILFLSSGLFLPILACYPHFLPRLSHQTYPLHTPTLPRLFAFTDKLFYNYPLQKSTLFSYGQQQTDELLGPGPFHKGGRFSSVCASSAISTKFSSSTIFSH